MEMFVGTMIDDYLSWIGPSEASIQFKKFLVCGTIGFEHVLHERPHPASPHNVDLTEVAPPVVCLALPRV
jgi:hypothetical protein